MGTVSLSGEDLLQSKICEVLDLLQIPHYSIPNGGHRAISVARRLKSTGLKAGIPDLHIPLPSGQFHSVYIEVKRPRIKPTTAQKEWHKKLRDLGHLVFICHSVDELIEIIKSCYPEKSRKFRE